MVTLFGISKFSATEYPIGTSIEQVASVNDFIIKRIEHEKDYYQDYFFDYKIINKKLEPHIIRRNGWSLGDFQSNLAWSPVALFPLYKDSSNKTVSDYSQIVNEQSFSILTQTFLKGTGLEAINSILQQFLALSKFKNLEYYIRKKYHIDLIGKSCKKALEETNKEIEKVEICKKDDFISLKKKFEQLKLENEGLKIKLKQLEQIIGKANRVFQKTSKKPS